MKRFIIVVFALAFVFALGALASAEPSFSGPTGLLICPTADIATPESAWLGFNYLDFSGAGADDTIWAFTLTGGLSENFELGASGFFHSDADDGFGINGKYAFMVEDERMPGVAFGVDYTDLGGNSMTQFYLVASKYFHADDISLDRAVGLHGGLSWVNADWVNDEFNYWAGLDFNLADNMIAIIEYVSTFGPNDNDALSLGIRYFANEQWSVQGGIVDGDMLIGTCFIF